MSEELTKAAQQALEALRRAVPKDAEQARQQTEAITAMSRALTAAQPAQAGCNHVLYETADADRPKEICDQNGEVVLAMCKLCRKAESELEATQPAAQAAKPDLSGHDAFDVLSQGYPTHPADCRCTWCKGKPAAQATPEPLIVKGAMARMVDAQVRDLWPTKGATLAPQQATPASAPQSLLMRLAGIAAECSDPDTTDALDALIAATQQATPEPVAQSRECTDPMCACMGGPCAECPEGEREKEIADLLTSLDFYKRRADALQQAQSRMRDPERTMVCDILANGALLVPAGDRYAATPTQQAAGEPVGEPFVATYSSESIGGKQHDTGRVNKGPRGGFFASTASHEDARLIAAALNAYTRPAAAPDTVPLDALHAVERERDYWKSRSKAMGDHAEGTCWYWMGDGEDHLESLVNSLPVVIRADQLRDLLARPAPGVPDVDTLAQFIRQIDGNHSMGAGALAERICEWLAAAQAKGGDHG